MRYGWLCPQCGCINPIGTNCAVCYLDASPTHYRDSAGNWRAIDDLEAMAADADVQRELRAIQDDFAGMETDGLEITP